MLVQQPPVPLLQLLCTCAQDVRLAVQEVELALHVLRKAVPARHTTGSERWGLWKAPQASIAQTRCWRTLLNAEAPPK